MLPITKKHVAIAKAVMWVEKGNVYIQHFITIFIPFPWPLEIYRRPKHNMIFQSSKWPMKEVNKALKSQNDQYIVSYRKPISLWKICRDVKWLNCISMLPLGVCLHNVWGLCNIAVGYPCETDLNLIWWNLFYPQLILYLHICLDIVRRAQQWSVKYFKTIG